MIKNLKGFTLVEVTVTTMIVAIIAYGALSAFPFYRKVTSNVRNANSCRAYLDSAFGRIERHGFQGSAFSPNFIPTIATNLPMHSGVDSISGAEITPLTSLPAIQFVNSDTLTRIRTPGLLMSSAAIVNALYNNVPLICSASVTFSGASLGGANLLPAPPADMDTSFAVQMTIKPYDIENRTEAACGGAFASGTVVTAPKGLTVTTTPAEQATPPIAGLSTEARNYQGFTVSLGVSFVQHGENKSCTEKRLISYSADLSAPSAPTASVVFEDNAFSATKWGPDDLRIRFTSPNESGIVLMCRDNSVYFAHPPNPPKVYPAAGPTDPPAASTKWVPCERVAACGKVQDTTGGFPTFALVSGGPSYSITSDWPNNGAMTGNRGLPYGCRIRIEVVALDPAGNVSAPYTLVHDITDP